MRTPLNYGTQFSYKYVYNSFINSSTISRSNLIFNAQYTYIISEENERTNSKPMLYYSWLAYVKNITDKC